MYETRSDAPLWAQALAEVALAVIFGEATTRPERERADDEQPKLTEGER